MGSAGSSKLRIIVSGLAGLQPVGGMAWHYLQYVLGLARLGHDVYYHEDTWTWPYHPIENTYTEDGSYSAQFIDAFFQRYAPDLRDRWHYLHLHEHSFGMARSAFDEVARSADVLINVSGACFFPEDLAPRCLKVFLDTDPGYNQIVLSEKFAWSPNVERWCQFFADHDVHFTFAENIDGANCTVPTVGVNWTTTRMPVVLGLWDRQGNRQSDCLPWSTIMTWNAFKGRLEYEGAEYKSKGPEFEKLLDVPSRLHSPVCVAVGGMSAPLATLVEHGWQVLDGPQATLTPQGYAEFIANSRGELSAAKHVYVAMRTGWFSERSTCYLASGRPVVVQDTGLKAILPVGEGLLTFSNADEAVDAIREVEDDYQRHARAARQIAAECFDSDKVLSKLLAEAFESDRHVADKLRISEETR